MRTGFTEHLVFALVLAITGLVLFGSSVNASVASICVFVFVVGSITPDIDSSVSTPRKIFRTTLLLASLAITIISITQYSHGLLAFCENVFGASCVFIIPFLALILPLLLVKLIEKKIPSHRGILHSIPAAIIYGIACFIFSSFSAPVGIAGFLGYAAHLLLDFLGKHI